MERNKSEREKERNIALMRDKQRERERERRLKHRNCIRQIERKREKECVYVCVRGRQTDRQIEINNGREGERTWWGKKCENEIEKHIQREKRSK